MIVTEGVAVSPQAQGFPNAPGIYSDEQTAGWRAVVDAVATSGEAEFGATAARLRRGRDCGASAAGLAWNWGGAGAGLAWGWGGATQSGTV